MKNIESIASKHLGRTASGEVMTPYKTPDKHDSSLLVGIPRSLNRDENKFVTDVTNGYDAWNCYEVSFLNRNGLPVSGVLRIVYKATSPNIVESKSLKLYLNSFNMERLLSTTQRSIALLEDVIENDLTSVIGEKVRVRFFENKFTNKISHLKEGVEWTTLEHSVSENISFNEDEGKNIHYLKVKYSPPNSYGKRINYHSGLLRSNCRVTNQPDWGDIFISYIPGKYVINNEELLKYIVSFRKENHFHEEVCEIVFNDLTCIFEPADLTVACLYTRRGGIDINPVRFRNQDLVMQYENLSGILPKTMRQ